jgi:hypothetical protein
VTRVVLLPLLCGLILSGCTRSQDPLDWKIAGSRPDQIRAWVDKNLPLMPRDIADEFSVALSNIKANTYRGRDDDLTEKDRRFCLRIKGRTVRAVMIEGKEMQTRLLTARLQNESTTILQLIRLSESSPPEKQAQLQRRVEFHRENLNRLKLQLEKTEQHLAELQKRGTPS